MLTIDLGNTRGKALLWGSDGEEVQVHASFRFPDPESDLPGGLGVLLREADPVQAAVASVADPEATRDLVEALQTLGFDVVLAPEPGIENRTRTPETVGLDRLYAARGALALQRSSVLVCDLGTALTVDAVEHDPVGGVGALLGGAIAPGPALGARALVAGTARLPEVEPKPGARALGRDTVEAIQAGLAVGIRGAAHALVEEIAAASGFEDPPVLLTGGGRAFLERPVPFTARRLVIVPELVQRGLFEAARDHFERSAAGDG